MYIYTVCMCVPHLPSKNTLWQGSGNEIGMHAKYCFSNGLVATVHDHS